MKKLIHLLLFIIFLVAGCSNMMIDLERIELKSGENILLSGTDGADVTGKAIDSDNDGTPDGIDINGDGTVDFTFIEADCSPAFGLYAADTNGDGTTDIYISVSSSGVSTMNTATDGSGTAVTVAVSDDETPIFTGADIPTGTGTDPGTSTPAVTATTDINGDGNIDAADTAILAKLTFTVTGDTVTITGANSSISGVLNIPASYDGKAVTSIDDSAFSGCSALTSVTIPDSVTSLEPAAFKSCTSLTSVTIPSNITTIGMSAFQGCTSLTSITIPASVTDIASSAFSGCSSLTAITIPDAVTEILSDTFNGCTSLSAITIPASITEIGESAFSGCSGLDSITIPANVTTIDSSAFSDCTGLTSLIMLPTTAPTAAADILAGTSTAVSLTYPAGENSYDEAGTVWVDTSVLIKDGDVDGDGVIDGDDTTLSGKLEFTLDGEEYILSDVFDTTISGSLFIPSTHLGKPVTSIGTNALRDCNALTSITIPGSITSIDNYAFGLCSSLETLTRSGATAPATGNIIFYGITIPINIIYPDGAAGYNTSPWEEAKVGDLNGDSKVDSKDIVIFNKLTFTETDTEAILTASSTSISDKLVLPPKVNGKPVTEISAGVFENRTLLKSVTIPASVTTIGNKAFNNCTNIKALTMLSADPPTLVSDVFDGITNSYLNLPSGATGYNVSPWNDSLMFRMEGDYNGDMSVDANDTAISNCLTWDDKGSDTEITLTGITNKSLSGTLIIPNTHLNRTVTAIEEDDLRDCNQITTLIIPDGVEFIGAASFSGWTALQSVTMPSGKLMINSNAFAGCSALTSISIPSDCTRIGSSAFENCSSLLSISIPSEVTTIYYNTFENCTSLESVTLSSGLTIIESTAFFGCSSLTSIILPETVEEIGFDAFKKCTSLKSINLPFGLTSIGRQLFYQCSALESIEIPEGVTEIEISTFTACTSLKTVTLHSAAAPVIETSGFWQVTGCTLRYPTGATGYNIAPWNDTDIFTAIETF
ncbi:MAG: leucine-rich repeat protein [Spirochaetales bacterium]|nr:leucine-rich repeat protein [Spirochaetales bacterium]